MTEESLTSDSATGQQARFIVDLPQPGSWNMAVDEALMHVVGEDVTSSPVLRFYFWNEPTLSLGYFQKHEERLGHSASREIAMVRRNSGGGAIVHHHELTYSLTIHQDHELAKKTSDLYFQMHQALVESLNDHGVSPSINENLDADLESNFLCFQRRAPNDVLLDVHKVCGSAQRKKFNAISQHGSVIFQTSTFAPEIIGINEISGKKLEYQAFISTWKGRVSQRLGWDLASSELSEAETIRAEEIQKVKFSTVKWCLKR